jgi:hypothetical protein
MVDQRTIARIAKEFRSVAKLLNERELRHWAAAQASSLGNVSTVSRITKIARSRIHRGMKELSLPASEREIGKGRVRRCGAGPASIVRNPRLIRKVEQLIEPGRLGMSPFRWTCWSTDEIAAKVTRPRDPVGARSVAKVLHDLGFTLRSRRRSRRRAANRHRIAQLADLNAQARRFLKEGQPVIFVETLVRQLIGKSTEVPPRESSEESGDRDGWRPVAINHLLVPLVSEAIRSWWTKSGRRQFRQAVKLLLVCDEGKSNAQRGRSWKRLLQEVCEGSPLSVLPIDLPQASIQWLRTDGRWVVIARRKWRGRIRLFQAVASVIGSPAADGKTVSRRFDGRRR